MVHKGVKMVMESLYEAQATDIDSIFAEGSQFNLFSVMNAFVEAMALGDPEAEQEWKDKLSTTWNWNEFMRDAMKNASAEQQQAFLQKVNELEANMKPALNEEIVQQGDPMKVITDAIWSTPKKKFMKYCDDWFDTTWVLLREPCECTVAYNSEPTEITWVGFGFDDDIENQGRQMVLLGVQDGPYGKDVVAIEVTQEQAMNIISAIE